MKQSTALAAALAVAMALPSARADVVTDWNVTAGELAATATPQVTNRVQTIMHAAMFDAVNAVAKAYTPYLVQPAAPEGTSPEAAGAAAAHAVLAWLLPGQRPALDAALKSSLAKVADPVAADKGVALGKSVAEKYVAARSDDGADRRVDYAAQAAPGKWRPTPPANQAFVSVLWADVKPFALTSAGEVKAPGPLAIDSAQYAKDLDEVRRVGARNSKERTADQTAAAIFSLIKASDLFNAAARSAAAAKGPSVVDNARVFALLNMAMMDATIAGWSIKRQYAVWRPVTAIRESTTNADPQWEPLLVTPPHPDYISGHCVTSGAGAAMLALLFGNDGVPFSATFGGPLGVTRSFSGFQQAEKEIGDARVWAGIHTRTADDHGGLVGHRVAEVIAQRVMRPVAR